MHENWPRPDPDTANPPPSNGPCVFRCNNRWRQAVETRDRKLATWIQGGCQGDEPAPIDIEPWPGEPVYCRKCAAVVRSALRELPLAYDALATTKLLTRTSSAEDERRGRSDVAPSPSPGADHQDEILRVACAWEDALRLHLKTRVWQRGAGEDAFTPYATLSTAVEYLNAHYDEMISWWDVRDFGHEVWRLYSVSVAMVKNKPVRKFLPVPCPSIRCGVRALVQEEGLALKPWYVECVEHLGGCGRLYSERDWDWFGELIVKGHVKPAEQIVST